MTAVECAGCYGTGVDEGGEAPILCPLCKGTASLSWDEVVRWGLEARYEAYTELVAEGARFVAAVGVATGGETQ